jgi:addiction module RelE/StbE family toxin
MKVRYHKQFVRHFKKRIGNDVSLKRRYAERLKIFMHDPESPVLRDHALKGTKLGLRSFSIAGDVRVVYKIVDGVAYFLDIGSHNQVY